LLPGDDILFSYLSMNTKQAKAEPLHEFLGRMGYQPAHVRGNDIWYKSPFRPDERTPSFKIDQVKNIWFDHGLGAGGTIIDFVQHLNQTQDISRVLASIADILGRPAAPTIIHVPAAEKPRTPPVIESLGVITDRGSAPKPAEFVLSVSAGIPRVEDSQGFHARILGSSRFS
jgi:hypothetical protein